MTVDEAVLVDDSRCSITEVRCNHLRRTQRPLFPTNISGVDAIRDDPTQIDPAPTLSHSIDSSNWFYETSLCSPRTLFSSPEQNLPNIVTQY